MINFFWLGALCGAFYELGRGIEHLVQLDQAGHGGDVLSAEVLERYAQSIDLVLRDTPKLGVPRANQMGINLSTRLRADTGYNVQRAMESLSTFYFTLLEESNLHRWLRVDGKFDAYILPADDLLSPVPWGTAVYETFPGVRDDIIFAGQSMAADLHTAAVFYAMRAAEHGLKWIAKRLKVKLKDNNKPLPIDEATWQRIIDGINSKIRQARQKTKGPRTRNRLEMYATAAQHCDYMKDIWRNNVSHAHKTYNALEAENAVDRVRDFMQSLMRIK
jgi:hypothetical protein